MQKMNYIHLNPVRAGMVKRTIDYRWSSTRICEQIPNDDEPLMGDFDRIAWRRA